MKKQITEADKEHENWYVEAREMTVDQLPHFIGVLTQRYEHDYGTICHAIAAAAIAAAWTVERSPSGGITGFQASAVMWEFIRHWQNVEGAARLLKFDDMLYPQYEDHFQNVISSETFSDLQEKAKKLLAEHDESMASKNVLLHWKSIVAGYVPFGWMIKDGK